MKTLFSTIARFSLCTLVADGDHTSTAKLDGSWTVTGGSDDGKQIPPGALDKLMMVVVFKDSNYNVSITGKEVEKGTYKSLPNRQWIQRPNRRNPRLEGRSL